jgi:hypothetical protein
MRMHERRLRDFFFHFLWGSFRSCLGGFLPKTTSPVKKKLVSAISSSFLSWFAKW